MRHLLVLVILAGTARADTHVSVSTDEPAKPALVRMHGVDNATIDRVAIALTREPTQLRATLRFRLSTHSRDALSLPVPIELTNGSSITGMSYAIGGEEAIVASLHEPASALDAYEEAIRSEVDPALLRWMDDTEDVTKYELAVFPVSRGMPAVVTITMTLPAASKILFDPVGVRHAHVDVMVDGVATVWRNVARARSLAMPTQPYAWMDVDPTPPLRRVDSTASLYAGDLYAEPVAIVHRHSQRPTVQFIDRRYQLRTLIRAHRPQLLNCYTYGKLISPELSPHATLALDITAAGNVNAVDVSGELDHELIRACIADEIKTWKFDRANAPRFVRQDIDLHELD